MDVKKYTAYSSHNFRNIPHVNQYLSIDEQKSIEVVGRILPFKVNNYVTDELIDWTNIPNDPIYKLTFPQREMLSKNDYARIEQLLDNGAGKDELSNAINDIRLSLNPHPAGQMDENVPEVNGQKLPGVQHKYDQTVLFFPSSGQTCHAYCTFCFRWPQFVGVDELKFAMQETELLVEYLRQHPEVTDVLLTGGDPMIMSAKKLASYLEPLLDADLPNLKTIRIGTKSLGYWPYKYSTDRDASETLELFKKVVDRGINLAFMAHFNNVVELRTAAVKEAIVNIRKTGAVIRSQSPIMRGINDSAEDWANMWQEQVDLGIVPYYMFVARDTGAQDYFAVPLADAHAIYRKAYQRVSGIARTVRGPSMSAYPGKIQILGVNEIEGQKVFTLRFLQGRNADWIGQPFFAKYDEQAIWLDELEPAFNNAFFYEKELSNALI
jgi:KamA family protein